MGKSVRSSKGKTAESGGREEVGFQRTLPLVDILVGATEGLYELVVDTGLQVLAALLEEDRTALCGARSKPCQERRASRHGFDRGQLVLGGRKVSVRKPRVRTKDGEELRLPSWEELAGEDPLRRRVVEQMLIGVSTRKYERSLEDLPSPLRSVASKKSSVSRRFVAKTQEQVGEFLGRSLEDLDLPILMFDGTAMGDSILIVALGIDLDGRKHVLGVREGTTESFETCRSLLRDLIDRGLPVEKARLAVIDGSKGLDKALRRVFGSWIVIQRCQVHKMRNVQEHLPKANWPFVREKLRQAWLRSDSFEEAQKRLLHLAASLDDQHPGAAASIREGLKETLALLKLGVAVGPLFRSLRTTNIIENLQGTLKATAKRVKRWRGGSMALRWAVSGIMEAETKFRRVRGYKDIPYLVSVLNAAVQTDVAKQDAA